MVALFGGVLEIPQGGFLTFVWAFGRSQRLFIRCNRVPDLRPNNPGKTRFFGGQTHSNLLIRPAGSPRIFGGCSGQFFVWKNAEENTSKWPLKRLKMVEIGGKVKRNMKLRKDAAARPHGVVGKMPPLSTR